MQTGPLVIAYLTCLISYINGRFFLNSVNDFYKKKKKRKKKRSEPDLDEDCDHPVHEEYVKGGPVKS
jgi:hypothetical protein